MADDTANKAYPYMFDPSQYKNTYSPYAGVALPFMGGYSGGTTGPTDAHGKPIQSYQDSQAAYNAWNAANPTPAMAPATTLNSSPYINSADRAGIQADSLMALNSMIDTGGGHYIAGPGTPPGFWDAQAAAQTAQRAARRSGRRSDGG